MKKRAVALSYDQVSVPRVVAKGDGLLAERIIETAQNEGIPIQEDPLLVETLSHIDLLREIPPELYQAVAEILALVYRMNELAKKTDLKDKD